MLINFGAIQSKSVNATIMLYFGSQDNHKIILWKSDYFSKIDYSKHYLLLLMLILCLIIHGTMNLLSNTCYIAQYMRCHRIINIMNISKIFLKFWQLPRPLTTSWPHPWPLATSWPFAMPPGHLLAVHLIILWPAYLVTLAENTDLERIKPNHVLEHLSMDENSW